MIRYRIIHKIKAILPALFAGLFLMTGCSDAVIKDNNLLGYQALSEREYDNALQFFDTAAEEGENAQETLRGQGIAYMGKADYDKAVTVLKGSLSESDGRIGELEFDTAFYLAVAEFRNGDPAASRDTCTSIINLRRDDPDAFFLRGKAELALNDSDMAVRDFNTAVELKKDDPDLYIDIYECMANAGLAEEGGNFLKSAMELTKINDFQKGKLYYFLEEYDEARDKLEAARGDGSDPLLILWLGKTYEALGDKSYAASLYKTYLEDNQGNVDIYNQLGLCEMDTGDYAAALESFETGLKQGGEEMDQSLLFNQIVAYEHLADFKKATVLMESYLSKYPDDEAAQREYKFLKTR
ncbi:MAG: tetratricopeptide repeat protein [Lachnospiraceae bacterium]|nr:tetratricopeptide repeat protein [Lachnospiraceae bacterium]